MSATLKRHALLLKNLSGADVVHAHWTGTGFVLEEPVMHSLLPVTVEDVTLQGSELQIAGRRMALTSDGRGGWLEGGPTAPVTILVDLGSEPVGPALKELETGLFQTSWRAALSEAPLWMGGGLETTGSTYMRLNLKNGSFCDCGAAGTAECAGKVPGKNIVEPQILLHGPATEYTAQARSRRVNGTVLIAYIVDETGKVIDPWLLSSLGSGLDESALHSLIKERFAPAACHKKPVAVPMMVGMGFHDF